MTRCSSVGCSLAYKNIINIKLYDAYDACMRTTVTIDAVLFVQVEELRRRERLSFKGALNQLLRSGLQYQGQPPKPTAYSTPIRKLSLQAGLDAKQLNQQCSRQKQ